ncbi:MAG: NAD(P)-dependent oxidoreductase [bacterium]|nr:NAD(P)-dependent oxidoreductase [bacterium]
MTYRILLVDERFQQKSRARFLVDYLPDGFELVIPDDFSEASLLRHAESANVILTAFAPITARMMGAAPNLFLVGKAGTGVDNIDVPAATEKGIPVANSPGSIRGHAVAEHALTLMLMLSRRPWLWDREGPRPLHNQLRDAALGIVGLGGIGQSIARMGAGFGMRILAQTRTRGKFRPEGFQIEEMDKLGDLLPQADYLVLSLPLSPDTRGLIGKNEFQRMKPGSFLINIARGPHVVTDDLVEALHSERIGGAGLDVTDPEPLPAGHPLRTFSNVVLSPHIASQTEQVQRMSYQLLCENIQRASQGERVTSLVNPEIYG